MDTHITRLCPGKRPLQPLESLETELCMACMAAGSAAGSHAAPGDNPRMRNGPFSLIPQDQPLEDTKQGSTLPSAGLEPAAQQAVRELLREGESTNTRNSYQSAMRYWAAWHALRFERQMQLPLDVPCVLQFIIDHALRQTGAGLASEMPAHMDRALVEAGYKAREGPLSHNTLVHRMAVLSKAHQVHGLANPCQDGAVRELMSRTRKAYARRGEQPAKKDAP